MTILLDRCEQLLAEIGESDHPLASELFRALADDAQLVGTDFEGIAKLTLAAARAATGDAREREEEEG